MKREFAEIQIQKEISGFRENFMVPKKQPFLTCHGKMSKTFYPDKLPGAIDFYCYYIKTEIQL